VHPASLGRIPLAKAETAGVLSIKGQHGKPESLTGTRALHPSNHKNSTRPVRISVLCWSVTEGNNSRSLRCRQEDNAVLAMDRSSLLRCECSYGALVRDRSLSAAGRGGTVADLQRLGAPAFARPLKCSAGNGGGRAAPTILLCVVLHGISANPLVATLRPNGLTNNGRTQGALTDPRLGNPFLRPHVSKQARVLRMHPRCGALSGDNLLRRHIDPSPAQIGIEAGDLAR
jgi:hypothetical protein